MQCSLAPSAYLASAAASSDLVHHIVPPTLQGSPIPHVDVAWSDGVSTAQRPGAVRRRGIPSRQLLWLITFSQMCLIPDLVLACMLASRAKESGAWLNVLPISSAWMTTLSGWLLVYV